MKKKIWIPLSAASAFIVLMIACIAGFCCSYPRPYKSVVQSHTIGGSLVYAVMKAESGFKENAVSRAGAIGLMQLKPSTAQFICERTGVPFSAEKLYDGAYNTDLGCRYLLYLLERFAVEATAIAAYNAGEGTVNGWLKDADYSADGRSLHTIPYPETRSYVKKVIKFKKIYDFLDG